MLFLLVSCSILGNLSCKEKEQEQVPPEIKVIEEVDGTPEMTHSNFKAIWETIKLLWESRDTELIPSVYAKEFVRVSPFGTVRTIEELSKEFEMMTGAYPDMKLVLDDYLITDNVAVMYWSASGTFTGELMGIKGNGQPFKNIKGITVLTFKGNRVEKDDSTWNALEMFQQTGYKIVEEVEE